MPAEPSIAAVDPEHRPPDPGEAPFGDGQPGAGPADGLQPGEAPESGRRRSWLGPGLAGLALAGWTAFFVWANLPAMQATLDPGPWTGWIGGWATPAVLIGVLWLIAMRSSRRESRRFGDVSRALAQDSLRLETRLLAINRELSLAREFVSAQARDLDSVGRIAVERLSQHADRLQSLVSDNGARTEAIGTVSAAALDNMERLREQLPVLTSAAKDLTSNFGNAGHAASARLDEMIGGFDRLVESGHASERLVAALRGRFDQTLDAVSARSTELEQAIDHRLAGLHAQTEHFQRLLLDHQHAFEEQLRLRSAALSGEIGETRRRLDLHEAESLTSLRSRLAALRDETAAVARALRDGESAALGDWRDAVARIEADMRGAGDTAERIGHQAAATSHGRMAQLAEEAAALERVLSETGARFEGEAARRRHAGEAQDRAIVDRLSAQLAALDGEISRRHAAQSAQLDALSGHGHAAAAQLSAIEARIAAIADSARAAEEGMTGRLQLLGERLGDSRQQLDATGHSLAGATDGSLRLLELIRDAATLSREDLARAIDSGVARLGDLESRAVVLRDAVHDADRKGEALSASVTRTHDRLGETTSALTAWHRDIDERAGSHAQTLETLKLSLARLDGDTAAVAGRARSELTAAIRLLDDAARAALDQIERRGATTISALAQELGSQSGDAIERAMRLQVSEISGKLEQAAAHAAGVSREAASQLREQLAKVDELVANLENRVGQARAGAQERVDDDFSRRVALITEALNSNAIDIAKALDSNVGDTAWSAYLRGDRGIFTRRAVRLLDGPEARGILQLYQGDHEFREHVSRYIHDFEAMLRQLLSTRDGHALGVTLLSSDMGKLYVALAQAIERLRS